MAAKMRQNLKLVVQKKGKKHYQNFIDPGIHFIATRITHNTKISFWKSNPQIIPVGFPKKPQVSNLFKKINQVNHNTNAN